MSDEPDEHPRQRVFGAERAKAFIDAVVAIAMTLLILPLMESVAEGAGAGHGAVQWLDDHQQQLISFVLSFVIIAMFWINHHRSFARVERVTSGLLWISMAWLLSIVWLPVATAMSGQMSAEDTGVKVVYIGSMIVTCLLTLVQRLFLHAHPQLHDISSDDLRRGMSVDISMAVLFGVALALSVAFPVLSYFPLFVMLLTGPVQTLVARMLGVRNP